MDATQFQKRFKISKDNKSFKKQSKKKKSISK